MLTNRDLKAAKLQARSGRTQAKADRMADKDLRRAIELEHKAERQAARAASKRSR